MNYDDLTDEILDHPNAQKIVNQVQSTLNKKKQARDDFREWLNDDIKAEFINGEIVMHSPIRRGHLNVMENLLPVLSTYILMNDLGEVSVEKALISLDHNDYEPDVVFWTKDQAKDFNDETMVHPVPSLVVEILSKNTKHKDRSIKFQDYTAHHISEYWIIDYHKQVVEKYILTADSPDKYVLHGKMKIGQNIESQIVHSFKIPVAAIFDKKVNLVVLKEIMK